MEVSDARKLKGLEEENRKLKKLAESMLDVATLREMLEKIEHAAQQIVFQEAIDAILRLHRLEQQLAIVVPGWSMAPVVAAYQAMREAAAQRGGIVKTGGIFVPQDNSLSAPQAAAASRASHPFIKPTNPRTS
jgi:hypothetical protein